MLSHISLLKEAWNLSYRERYTLKIPVEDRDLLYFFQVLVCHDCGWYISQGVLPTETTEEEDIKLRENVKSLSMEIEMDFSWGPSRVRNWNESMYEREESTEACRCCNTRLLGKRYNVDAAVVPRII